MAFQWLFLLDYVRKISILFFICGLAAFYVDYRGAKKKSSDKRELTFSRTAALVYIIGSAVCFSAACVAPAFL